MRKTPFAVLALTLSGAALALGAAATAAKPATTNWNAAVTRTAQDTHILGNPAARLRLTQFVSYTCSHCAQFDEEADAPLRMNLIAKGQGAVEVRHFVRDPVDVTVALLTNCGPANKFFLNHAAFMRSQSKWIGPLASPTAEQRERWMAGSFAQRTKTIAKDFGFYRIMATRGYTAQAVDLCLANEALANRLAADTELVQRTMRVTGTPSFAIDGALLAGTHSWDALRPQIDARLTGS